MTSQEIDYFYNQYFVYNRRLLSIVGLWPYQDTSQRLRYAYSISIVVITGIIIQVIQISALLIMVYTPEQVLNQFQTSLPMICFGACYCNLLTNLSMVRKIYDRMKCDWYELANEKEIITMKKFAKQTKLWTLSITYLCYLYTILLIIPSVISAFLYIIGTINQSELILPVHIDYFLQNKSRYFSMLSIQIASIIIISTLGIANYATFVSFLQHIRALFSITELKIDYPFQKDFCRSCVTRSFTSSRKEQEWIVGVIRCYNESIKFFEIVKSLFGKVYLMETLIALLFIIVDFLYVFTLFSTTKSITDVLRDCIYIMSTILVIFVYCYLGQKIIDDSNNVFIKCCQVPFYTLSLKTQKNLLMLIMKAIRPCNFSVTKTIITSLEMFSYSTRASFSYALVFYNIF